MDKNYYSISYYNSVISNLPPVLRKPFIMAVVAASAQALTELHNDFSRFAESVDTNIYTQVCYMQGLLNDNFDYYERRIIVRNVLKDYDSFVLFREDENKPVEIMKESASDFEPRFIGRDGMLAITAIDFEVVLPVGFSLSETEENRLKALVNRNKLASKRFSIVYG